MNILVLNCGSSSVKYQLVEMGTETVLARGLAERIGLNGSRVKHDANNQQIVIEKVMPDHVHAVDLILSLLTDPKHGVIESIEAIDAVGHRVVHGGEYFISSTLITEEVMKTLNDCIPLAPLHNPANIMGINAILKVLPKVPQVGVFDTAFHQTMPKESFLYAIPYEYYEKYRIRKYGFHGTSHRYVAQRAAALLGKSAEEVNLITAHLGNGASITAIRQGKSYDHSLGYTPLAGLVMGTRCGDIDPAIPLVLIRELGIDSEEVDSILNKKSGMLGLSGVSSDMRDLQQKADAGDMRCQLALSVYCHTVKRFIGSYMAVLGHVDALVFTAGIGENSNFVREHSVEGLRIGVPPRQREERRDPWEGGGDLPPGFLRQDLRDPDQRRVGYRPGHEGNRRQIIGRAMSENPELAVFATYLKEGSLEEALMAIEVLSQIDDPEARTLLIEALKNPLWQVRNALVEALIPIISEVEVPLLIEKMKSQSAKERNASRSIMNNRGDVVIPFLVKNLQSPTGCTHPSSTLGMIKAWTINEILKVLTIRIRTRESAIEALGS